MRSCNLEEYITDIECYGNTGLSKADNISMVIQRNHLDQSFYVGDTAMDAGRQLQVPESPLSMLPMVLDR